MVTELVAQGADHAGDADVEQDLALLAPLSSANFTVISSGGVNNSSYLVGTKNESSSSAGSIGTGWNIASGKKYYFSYQVKYLNSS